MEKNLSQYRSIARAASLFALPNWGLCYKIWLLLSAGSWFGCPASRRVIQITDQPKHRLGDAGTCRWNVLEPLLILWYGEDSVAWSTQTVHICDKYQIPRTGTHSPPKLRETRENSNGYQCLVLGTTIHTPQGPPWREVACFLHPLRNPWEMCIWCLMCRRYCAVLWRYREVYLNDLPAMEKCRGGQQALGEKCQMVQSSKCSWSR